MQVKFLKDLSKVLKGVDSVVIGNSKIFFDTGGVIFVMRCPDFDFGREGCYCVNLNLPIKVASVLDDLMEVKVYENENRNEIEFDIDGTNISIPVFAKVLEDVSESAFNEIEKVVQEATYVSSEEIENLKKVSALKLVSIGSYPLSGVLFFHGNYVFGTSGIMHLIYLFSDKFFVRTITPVLATDLFSILQFFDDKEVKVGFSQEGKGIVIDGGDAKAIVRRLDFCIDLEEFMSYFQKDLVFVGSIPEKSIDYFGSLVKVAKESDTVEIVIDESNMKLKLRTSSGVVRGEAFVESASKMEFFTKVGILEKLLQVGNVLYKVQDGRGIVWVGDGGRLRVYIPIFEAMFEEKVDEEA